MTGQIDINKIEGMIIVTSEPMNAPVMARMNSTERKSVKLTAVGMYEGEWTKVTLNYFVRDFDSLSRAPIHERSGPGASTRVVRSKLS